MAQFVPVCCHHPRAEVIAEARGWSVVIPGIPVAADGATLTGALDEMVDALREYATDWVNHLATAPNHAGNGWLVQVARRLDDESLADWLVNG